MHVVKLHNSFVVNLLQLQMKKATRLKSLQSKNFLIMLLHAMLSVKVDIHVS